MINKDFKIKFYCIILVFDLNIYLRIKDNI